MSSDMQTQQPGMSQPWKKSRHAATKRSKNVHAARAPIVHKRLTVIHMRPRNQVASRQVQQRPHLAAQRLNGANRQGLQGTSGFGSSTPNNRYMTPDSGDIH
jgi:hypothetical protein